MGQSYRTEEEEEEKDDSGGMVEGEEMHEKVVSWIEEEICRGGVRRVEDKKKYRRRQRISDIFAVLRSKAEESFISPKFAEEEFCVGGTDGCGGKKGAEGERRRGEGLLGEEAEGRGLLMNGGGGGGRNGEKSGLGGGKGGGGERGKEGRRRLLAAVTLLTARDSKHEGGE